VGSVPPKLTTLYEGSVASGSGGFCLLFVFDGVGHGRIEKDFWHLLSFALSLVLFGGDEPLLALVLKSLVVRQVGVDGDIQDLGQFGGDFSKGALWLAKIARRSRKYSSIRAIKD